MKLEIQEVSKRYRRGVLALDKFSLELKPGVLGLLGPNGAGKTTCFYLVTGLVTPDSGTITLDGLDVTGFPMYRRARLGQRDCAGADQRVKFILKFVLDVRIPRARCVGFGPQVADVFRTTQSRSNQIIDLIVARASIHNSILVENLLTQQR